MHAKRRDLLLAGCCSASTALFWSVAARLRAEGLNPPPETTTIRLAKNPTICIAPQYVVSDLLNADVRLGVWHARARRKPWERHGGRGQYRWRRHSDADVDLPAHQTRTVGDKVRWRPSSWPW
jgi:hypothetical protein